MEYRAVGDRCAVDFAALNLPVSDQVAHGILIAKGFTLLDVDLVALARGCVGTSIYRRGARLTQAPEIVDCSGFIKWLYGQRGLWLPRRSIQQREVGEPVDLEEVCAGDVMFVTGALNYFLHDPADGVGHVGLATNDQTIIHAANKKLGVIESSLNEFIGTTGFRGARRYVPSDRTVQTVKTPAGRGVEISDDFRWIILQSLPTTKKNY